MATLGGSEPTLSDDWKRMDPNRKVESVEDLLAQEPKNWNDTLLAYEDLRVVEEKKMPNVGECDCGQEDAILYPDGRCQRCVEFDDAPYNEKPRGDFQYARNFDEEPHTVICRECGSDQFIVGRRSYYTAIKCAKCKWERCVHSG